MKTNLKQDRRGNRRPNLAIRIGKQLASRVRSLRNAIEQELAAAREGHQHLVRLALNEAEALAWQTDYPHLMFPILAEEKVRALSRWERRQALILRQEDQQAFAE